MIDKDTITRLAQESGIDYNHADDHCRVPYWSATTEELERFALAVYRQGWRMRLRCAKRFTTRTLAQHSARCATASLNAQPPSAH